MTKKQKVDNKRRKRRRNNYTKRDLKIGSEPQRKDEKGRRQKSD